MQRVAARAGLVGTLQRALRPSQLVMRRLRLRVRDHRRFSGDKEKRSLVRRRENAGDFL